MKPLGAWAEPLAWVYGFLSLAWRRVMAPSAPRRLPGQRCISVGNLSSGGSGKTPVVAEIAKLLRARGMVCAVLTRGYGGQSRQRPLRVSDFSQVLARWPEAGDEAELLARQLPGVPVMADPNRLRAAADAHQAWNVDHWVLDDGFQRRYEIARDLDLLMVHTSDLRPLERVIPAGRLREPWSQGAQASAVIISGPRQGLSDETWVQALPAPLMGKPIFHLRLEIMQLEHLLSGTLAIEELVGHGVLAISALGRPEGFEASLAAAGAKVRSQRFSDHHAFSERELAPFVASLEPDEKVVISAKDAIKWPSTLNGPWGPWILQVEARVEPQLAFEALVLGN